LFFTGGTLVDIPGLDNTTKQQIIFMTSCTP
jgi:hypothetical protein